MLVRRALLPTPNDRVTIDRLFGDLMDGFPFATNVRSGNWNAFPALNSWEDEKSYHVEAELPGLTEKEIDVSVLGNELTLSGSREATYEENTSFHRRERHSGKFERVVRFAVDIDASKIEASFKNGVLTITLPKVEKALPRKIEVKK